MQHFSPALSAPRRAGHLDLEVPVEKIHGDWLADWGRSIRSPTLRTTLIENPRLSARISGEIASVLGIGTPDPKLLKLEDLAAWRLVQDRFTEVMRVCGLVKHGRMLAHVIEGSELRAYARVIDLDDIRLAISIYRDLPSVSDAEAAIGIDVDRFAEITDRSGLNILLAWANSLPSAFTGRFMLMLPKASSFEIGRTSFPKQSSSLIVHHVTERIATRP